MDSWSRPNKSSATPPPLYLTSNDVKYCTACGRVIGTRRSHKQNEVIKYCSDGCRKRRLGPVDKKIDRTILSLLLGEKESGIDQIDTKCRVRKGDHRTVIFCGEIERIAFDRPQPPSKKDEDPEGVSDFEEGGDEDLDPAELQGKRPNPGGPGSKEKQQEGQKRAEEREMVRRAARRAVVFGFPVEKAYDGPAAHPKSENSEEKRKCEALMSGQVVEPSFAKGDWAIRWRDG